MSTTVTLTLPDRKKKPSIDRPRPIPKSGVSEPKKEDLGAEPTKQVNTGAGNTPVLEENKTESKVTDLSLYEARQSASKIVQNIYKGFQRARKTGKDHGFRELQDQICDNAELLFSSGAMSLPEINKALMDVEEFIKSSRSTESSMAQYLGQWLNGSDIGDNHVENGSQELQAQGQDASGS